MIQVDASWELLAKAVSDKEAEIGRPLTDAERRELREAMERHGCDEVQP